MNSLTEKRLDYIDIARGIGIILVAFVHVQFGFTKIYIESFLMPLFFFISGFLSHHNTHKTNKSFISNRFKRLMYPYFLWSSILFLFWFLFDTHEGLVSYNLFGIVYASGGKQFMEWGIMLWFLPCLFLTETIHYLGLKYGNKYASVIILILSFTGFFISGKSVSYLTWSLNISLAMLLFYHIGFMVKIFSARITFRWHIISYSFRRSYSFSQHHIIMAKYLLTKDFSTTQFCT